jgi:hypothetical protein
MFDDTFIAPLPRSQYLAEIEQVADFITKKIITAKKSYQTSTDVGEKIDILLCLITYQSTLSLLNAAYLTEDYEMLDKAKETYREIPDFVSHTTNFASQDIELYLDKMTDAIQASLSLDVVVLSHLTENQTFIKRAANIYKGSK